MFGKDPNWGRILSSAGSSGCALHPHFTDLYFEDVQILDRGRPQEVDSKLLHEIVARDEYKILLNLNLGDGAASAWTCDLSYDYVKINAEYTT